MKTLRRLRQSPKDKGDSSLYFDLCIPDAGLDFSQLSFRPSSIVAVVSRHRQRWYSEPAQWEASLRSPREGFCFWHPTFTARVRITDVAEDLVAAEELHKDVFVSVENVDEKRRRKLLAKARIDLLEFKSSAKRTSAAASSSSPRTFRLKLHPETKKVSKCYVSVSIQLVDDENESGDIVSKHLTRPEVVVNPSNVSLCGSLGSIKSTESPSAPASSRSSIGMEFTVPKNAMASLPEKTPLEGDVPKARAAVAEDDSTIRPSEEVQKQDDSMDKVSTCSPDHSPNKFSFALTDRDVTPAKQATNPTDISKIIDASAWDYNDEQPKVTRIGGNLLATSTPNKQETPSRLLLSSVKKKKEEEMMLSWAKQTLADYHQVKITNLSSSWQNGLGFCALIHSSHPSLVPWDRLKASSADVNFQLALSACELLGGTVPAELKDLKTMPTLSAKSTCMFLSELKMCIESKDVHIDETAVSSFKQQWFNRKGVFEEYLSSFCEDETPSEIDNSLASAAPESKEETATPTATPAPTPTPPPLKEDTESPARDEPMTANRRRALEMIAMAQQQQSPPPSEEDAEAVKRSYRESRDIGQIANELRLLELENDRITHEQDLLVNVIRKNENADSVMPRYLELVNEKNGVVRRQMQLNILEKSALISRKQEAINEELQKLSQLDEDHKTEETIEREQRLLNELVALVNEKNELVHHLDNQERGIEVDETIQASLNPEILAQRKEECAIQ